MAYQPHFSMTVSATFVADVDRWLRRVCRVGRLYNNLHNILHLHHSSSFFIFTILFIFIFVINFIFVIMFIYTIIFILIIIFITLITFIIIFVVIVIEASISIITISYLTETFAGLHEMTLYPPPTPLNPVLS